jgi:hypothetical protein
MTQAEYYRDKQTQLARHVGSSFPRGFLISAIAMAVFFGSIAVVLSLPW